VTSDRSWKAAWVTGASSGIGRELALQLARRGVKVAASARSREKLAELQALDANIRPFAVDVTDRQRVSETAAEIEAEIGPIDLLVLNAGIWQPMGPSVFSAETFASAMNVNVLGAVNAIEPILRGMLERQSGHIALVGSVAGYRGLPKSGAYAPTKAALISLAECLAHELPMRGIKVSVINPGFVETPMTRINKFPMPFILKPDDAAARIIAGLERGRYEIAFPWPMVLATKAARLLPNRLFFWFMRLSSPLGER